MQIDKQGQRWRRNPAGVPLLFFTCATRTLYQEKALLGEHGDRRSRHWEGKGEADCARHVQQRYQRLQKGQTAMKPVLMSLFGFLLFRCE